MSWGKGGVKPGDEIHVECQRNHVLVGEARCTRDDFTGDLVWGINGIQPLCRALGKLQ